MALLHFQAVLYQAWPSLTVFRPVLDMGHTGVPLFFVLSGFIIWHNYGTKATLTPRASASFLWRRSARLWPVCVFTQVLAIPVLWVSVHHLSLLGYSGSWLVFARWLASEPFMVQEVGRPVVVFQSEPACLVSDPRDDRLLLLSRFAGGGARRSPLHEAAAHSRRVALARAPPGLRGGDASDQSLCLFVVGAVASPFHRWVLLRISGPPTRRALPLVMAAQVVAPALVVIACYTHHTWYIGALLAIWVYSLSIDHGPGIWFFSTRPMQTGGYASYSLYMLHWFVFAAGGLLLIRFPAMHDSPFLQIYAVSCLVIVTVGAWALWRFYETPSRRKLNRLFERAWPTTSGARKDEPVSHHVPRLPSTSPSRQLRPEPGLGSTRRTISIAPPAPSTTGEASPPPS